MTEKKNKNDPGPGNFFPPLPPLDSPGNAYSNISFAEIVYKRTNNLKSLQEKKCGLLFSTSKEPHPGSPIVDFTSSTGQQSS